MLLVIDIGNTHITIGVYSGEELIANWRISSGVERTVDERWIGLNVLFGNENINLSDVKGCAISSVVPDQTSVFIAIAQEKLKTMPVVVNAQTKTDLKILYDDPNSVGADRICNSVAGLAKFGGPLIIVDSGTATTFDVVSEKREYLGGVIAPGIESSSNVLHKYAARLPKVELTFPKNIIGKTTEASMQAGIMYGSVDMINGIIGRLLDELGQEARIIATGGMVKQVFEKLDYSPQFEPLLTLEGLRIIYEMNEKSNG